MALNTLKIHDSIDGFSVLHQSATSRQGTPPDAVLGQDYVVVDHEVSTITFKIQDGPIGEVGINGCQVDTMIGASLLMLRHLNHGEFACRENSIAITKLEEALHWLKARKKDREERGVEGFNKA